MEGGGRLGRGGLGRFRDDSFPRACGKYELLERIGSGGMAEVFRARLPGAGGFEKIVVVKRILPHLAHRKQIVRMFVAEARLTALAQHKNIVQVFELGEIEDGEFFMVMEYIKGTDLRRLLKSASRRKLRVPPWFSVHVLIEVLEGLAFAHDLADERGRSRNVVHRDVTPSNIFISQLGEIKLGDFGIAKSTSQETLTEAGQLKGKITYMAPEQLNGKELDRRTDVFSAAVVLWECLTQRRLFADRNNVRAITSICLGERAPPSRHVDDIPPDLDGCILRALEIEPERRTPSARAFQAELIDILPSLSRTLRPQMVRGVVHRLLGGDAIAPEDRVDLARFEPPRDTGFDEESWTDSATFTGTPTAASLGDSRPSLTHMDLSFEKSAVAAGASEKSTTGRGGEEPASSWLVSNPHLYQPATDKIPEFSTAQWAAHGLSADRHVGPNAFWLMSGDGKHIGPCGLEQVMIVIKAEARLRLGTAVGISVDRERWIDLAEFARLTLQEAMFDVDATKIPKKGAPSGFLDQRGAASVLAGITRDRLSGRLYIVPEGIRPMPRREIHFKDGAPTYVYASEEHFTFPSVLIQRKAIEYSDLPAMIHEVVRERIPIEDVFARRGGNATKQRVMLMKDRLVDVFRWSSGRFAFVSARGQAGEAAAHDDSVPFATSLLPLLAELVHRALSTQELRSALVTWTDSKLEPSSRFAAGLSELGLAPAQRDVAHRLTKGKKLSSLVRTHPEEERIILLVAYILTSTDLVVRG